MDYMHEELLRQWKALSALLLGGRRENAQEEKPGSFAGRQDSGGENPWSAEKPQWAGGQMGRRLSEAGRFAAEAGQLSGESAPDGNGPLPSPFGKDASGSPPAGEESLRIGAYRGRMSREAKLPAEKAGSGFSQEKFILLGGGAPGRRTEGSWTGLASAGLETESGAGGVRDGAAANARWVTEILPVESAAAAGPKELSRTFQRDARRYDGGFSLY